MAKKILKYTAFLFVWFFVVVLSWVLSVCLHGLFRPELTGYLCYTSTGIEFELAYYKVMSCEALAILIIGYILVCRHRWGRTLRRHFWWWYLAVVMMAVGYTVYLASTNTFYSYFAVAKSLLISCLFPLFSMLLLSALVWLMRKFHAFLLRKKTQEKQVEVRRNNKWWPLFIIGWILMQPVAALISGFIAGSVAKLLFPNFWGYAFPSGMKVAFAEFECLFFDIVGVGIIGAILVIRHGYGTVKFWKHSVIWYFVFFVATMSVIIYMAYDWGVLEDYCFVEMVIMNDLYPICVLLELMAVVWLMRLLKKGVLKNNNGDNELSLT